MAVSESRLVTFDAAEVRSAVLAVPRLARALGLHQENYASVEFRPDDRMILFGTGVNQKDETVTVGSEGLVALLVAYCSRLGIPLPRRAMKNLDVLSDRLVLRVDVPPPERRDPPAHRRRAEAPEIRRAMIWSKTAELLSR
jgi:hypothetical protein